MEKQLKSSQNAFSSHKKKDQGIYLCKKHLLFCILSLSIICIVLSSCLNGMDSLMDNYNSNFAVSSIKTDDSKQPGDEGFDETTMLRQNYFVYSDATLSLAAPYGCDKYEWTIVDFSTGLELDVVTYGNSSKTSRKFVTYVPDSPWVIGRTYKLTLTVKKEDVEYTDSCEVVIYKHYDF